METPTMPYDLEFLLRAASFSTEAKEAVDVIARRMKVVSEAQLQVAQEQLKEFDPAEAAKSEPPPTFFRL
jgi:hypothetical protein